MSTRVKITNARLKACLPLILIILIWPIESVAGVQQDAINALSRIRNLSSKSQELTQIEATFSIAEQYWQNNDTETAGFFYRLTVEKCNVAQALLSKVKFIAPVTNILTANQLQKTIVDHYIKPTNAVTPSTDTLPQSTSVAISTPTTSEGVTIETVSPFKPKEVNLTEYLNSKYIIGEYGTYTVVKGDTIRLVAAKLGVHKQNLADQNGLSEKAKLKTGQKLIYDNRKIVPQSIQNGIVINIPDRTLYYFKQGKLEVSIPVALGVSTKSDKYDWKTPVGRFKVTAKVKDPTWYVPQSIQSEMVDHGKNVITSIPPGPTNPLGKYAIRTTMPGILIHSTTKPWSIYSFASHGCIRVYPENMEKLFKVVDVNTSGEIIYKPVKLVTTEQGRVFMEVHPDVYGMRGSLLGEARRIINKMNLSEQVNWKKVEMIVKRKSGIAEEISI